MLGSCSTVLNACSIEYKQALDYRMQGSGATGEERGRDVGDGKNKVDIHTHTFISKERER
jgi:hypothetical protein